MENYEENGMGFPKFLIVLAMCLCEILACEKPLDDKTEIESERVALTGEFFEPRALWQKPMEEKLRFFADPIMKYGLCDMVAKHYWWRNMPGMVCTFVSPKPKPYTPEEATNFQDAIWGKLQEYIAMNNLQLRKDDFIRSLRQNIHPESCVYDAPLIHHFESHLMHKASFEHFVQKNNFNK